MSSQTNAILLFVFSCCVIDFSLGQDSGFSGEVGGISTVGIIFIPIVAAIVLAGLVVLCCRRTICRHVKKKPNSPVQSPSSQQLTKHEVHLAFTTNPPRPSKHRLRHKHPREIKVRINSDGDSERGDTESEYADDEMDGDGSESDVTCQYDVARNPCKCRNNKCKSYYYTTDSDTDEMSDAHMSKARDRAKPLCATSHYPYESDSDVTEDVAAKSRSGHHAKNTADRPVFTIDAPEMQMDHSYYAADDTTYNQYHNACYET
ncbi:uncharacterized protein LOC106163382 [Lingula anatina]|uniref:Uncharacterized protein LOC106163382 n=1 Tax=Lingula anatina TaxID=7574 RepID=A0A1S3IE07_LINAN|nr:uncharacterized protein LOC106163382 [Lingula anatina]|eukprot:XP_013396393.1 uncharacterized protein LOC106163382 [Lingula anatina]